MFMSCQHILSYPYFQERCVGGTRSDNFWKTIKPWLSKKNTSGPNKVILTENSKLITKQNEVSETFNSFFYKCSQ